MFLINLVSDLTLNYFRSFIIDLVLVIGTQFLLCVGDKVENKQIFSFIFMALSAVDEYFQQFFIRLIWLIPIVCSQFQCFQGNTLNQFLNSKETKSTHINEHIPFRKYCQGFRKLTTSQRPKFLSPFPFSFRVIFQSEFDEISCQTGRNFVCLRSAWSGGDQHTAANQF